LPNFIEIRRAVFPTGELEIVRTNIHRDTMVRIWLLVNDTMNINTYIARVADTAAIPAYKALQQQLDAFM